MTTQKSVTHDGSAASSSSEELFRRLNRCGTSSTSSSRSDLTSTAATTTTTFDASSTVAHLPESPQRLSSVSECARFLSATSTTRTNGHHHRGFSPSQMTHAEDQLRQYLAWRQQHYGVPVHSCTVAFQTGEYDVTTTTKNVTLMPSPGGCPHCLAALSQDRSATSPTSSATTRPEPSTEVTRDNDGHDTVMTTATTTVVPSSSWLSPPSHAHPPQNHHVARWWDCAVAQAYRFFRRRPRPPKDDDIENSRENDRGEDNSTDVDRHSWAVPQVLYDHRMSHTGETFRDADGYRVIHALPARIDPHGTCIAVRSLVGSESSAHFPSPTKTRRGAGGVEYGSTIDVYITTLALYMDHLWTPGTDQARDRDPPPRESPPPVHGQSPHPPCRDDRITVCIDVRPGRGWANPPASTLISFIRHVTGALAAYYPERLHQCVIYPVPRPAVFLWHVIQPLLTATIRQRIVLVAGAAGLQSPLPRHELEKYVPHHGAESFWDVAEAARLNSFQ